MAMPPFLVISLATKYPRFFVDTSLEAIARISRNAEPSACRANSLRIESRDLEQNIGCGLGYFTALSTNHAGDCLRVFGVSDHRHRIIERSIDAIERENFLALFRAAHDDLRAVQLRQVERMHRLTESVQHVVRHIDDVAD